MIGFIFLRLLNWWFSIMPFSVLYKISDVLSWVLYHVVKYRREVVEQQLRMSFPEKSDEALKTIAKKSYANLGDILVESIKGFTMPKAQFKNRMIYVNTEVIQKYIDQNTCVILAGAHYGNWEWACISYPLWLLNPVIGFYKPLSNVQSDAFAAKQRSRFGVIMTPIDLTTKTIMQYKHEPATMIFISDQSTWSDHAHWVTFLRQDTACPQGIDKVSRLLRCPVIYMDIQRVKRGCYEIILEEITDGKQNYAHGEITTLYMQKLESVICRKPEDWLWTHKRWKKKKK